MCRTFRKFDKNLFVSLLIGSCFIKDFRRGGYDPPEKSIRKGHSLK